MMSASDSTGFESQLEKVLQKTLQYNDIPHIEKLHELQLILKYYS